ncbi:MAG: TRAP transporter large permease [Rhodobacteraceae bacterium]|nr:TRAP transporter large permease [Paracoccaceae bacterium]
MTLALVITVAIVLLVFGFPMFLVLMVPAMLVKFLFYPTVPDLVLVQKTVAGMNHSVLLAIPFFIFAAELMGRGEIARQLTAMMAALFRRRAGGMGYSTIGAAAGFGAVSGSAPATVAALGGLTYPRLKTQGFSDRFSLGLIASSAEIALLIPPSLVLIIYGWLTGTSIARLFAAGLVVGVVLAIAFSFLVATKARHLTPEARGDSASKPRDLKVLWALGMPVIILGGIYSGFFTPTEAAAVSVIYAILVEGLVLRNLTLKKLMTFAENAAVSSAVIFILLAVGSTLAYFITIAQVPAAVIGFMQYIDAGPITFLIIINILFLITGMFIDPGSALLILVPTMFPVAQSLGIDPVHFGIVVSLNICTGMITPPFGLDNFVAASTLQKSVAEVSLGVLPFVAVNIAVLLLITYVPGISTFLPNLLMG